MQPAMHPLGGFASQMYTQNGGASMFAPAQYQPQAGQPGTFQLDMMYNSNGLLLLVNTKLDSIMNKLMSQPTPPLPASAQPTTTTTPTGQMTSGETSALLENITRIVRDNEQLRSDVDERKARVHEQNEKITSLLSRVQSLVEKNHACMESETRARLLADESAQRVNELSAANGALNARLRQAEQERDDQRQINTHSLTQLAICFSLEWNVEF